MLFKTKLLKLVQISSFLIIILSLTNCSQKEVEVKEIKPVINYDNFGFISDSLNVYSRSIKKNETLADILMDAGVNYKLVTKIFSETKPTFDFRKIQPDRNFTVYKNTDSLNSFYGLAYEINKIKYLKILSKDSLQIDIIERDITRREKSVIGTINSSLYQTLIDANSSIVLAGELADVFAWQIDFYTIQKGDQFFAVYDELFVGDESVGIGDVLVAKFIHKGNSFNAFLFTQNGREEYFDEEGKSLQKEFLKAPLKYKRISSGYSGRRLHPILRVYKPHRGIDYAAAIGTPVQAVGDGIVLQVGRNGAAGRMVKIRHNSTYSSAYLHLSGYGKGIKRNAKVKQGQVIGYVGSSGRSTGPHLDFRFWKRGALVNYLNQKFPSSKAVADSNLLDFNILIDSLSTKLNEVTLVGNNSIQVHEQENAL